MFVYFIPVDRLRISQPGAKVLAMVGIVPAEIVPQVYKPA